MSGTDGLNPQGIKRTTEVRATFTLSDPNEILCGGDFVSFEVSIAEAVYNDPALRQALLSGKKIHALLAMELFPGKTYEEILASEGTSNDMYDKGKRGVFLIIYGGEAPTMVDKGIADTLEIAENAIKRFITKHPQIGVARKRIYEMFCSMRQPGGIGTKVEWHEPAPYIESKLGFRRYFTLENRIAKELFILANDPPKEWREVRVKVVRRDRQQTASGACQSALFGAAFGIQAGNLRAAANHEIQSFGAGITKNVQRKVWDIQPAGIHKWRVRPINIHDELLTATAPEYVEEAQKIVKETVASFKSMVPLIKIDWKIGMKSWANKKG
jgi:DNA polymerase I-like protein with 3'-5' exonuclease and polymerase domains